MNVSRYCLYALVFYYLRRAQVVCRERKTVLDRIVAMTPLGAFSVDHSRTQIVISDL